MKSPKLQTSVIRNLVLLSGVDLRPVLDHSGGPEINSWLLRIRVQSFQTADPQFRDGLRITDALTMEVVEMALIGKVNKNLVSLINLRGGTAVGLCGKYARPSPNAAVLGFIGEVVRVAATVPNPIIASWTLPVAWSADENHHFI